MSGKTQSERYTAVRLAPPNAQQELSRWPRGLRPIAPDRQWRFRGNDSKPDRGRGSRVETACTLALRRHGLGVQTATRGGRQRSIGRGRFRPYGAAGMLRDWRRYRGTGRATASAGAQRPGDNRRRQKVPARLPHILILREMARLVRCRIPGPGFAARPNRLFRLAGQAIDTPSSLPYTCIKQVFHTGVST